MKKHLTSNRGITLIEVLVTLVIMAIASTGIYGTFTMGLKLYQKIGIEGKLRDDADYAVTMILNEMYDNPPSYIINTLPAELPDVSNKKGIELVRYEDKKITNNYIIEDSTDIKQDLLIYFENDNLYLEKIEKTKNGTETTIKTLEKTEISSESSQYDSNASSILLNENPDFCSQIMSSTESTTQCIHGRIEITLVMKDREHGTTSLLKTEPLKLTSTFGF